MGNLPPPFLISPPPQTFPQATTADRIFAQFSTSRSLPLPATIDSDAPQGLWSYSPSKILKHPFVKHVYKTIVSTSTSLEIKKNKGNVEEAGSTLPLEYRILDVACNKGYMVSSVCAPPPNPTPTFPVLTFNHFLIYSTSSFLCSCTAFTS